MRAVGPWGLAASIISMIVGAGIFAVPAALAACIGTLAPLAFLLCGIGVGAVAICFAEGGSRVPTSGGVYGVIDAALGPLAGYVCGILLGVCCVFACGAVAAALADVVATLFLPSLMVVVRTSVVVGVLGGIAWVNIRGVASGARLVSASTTLKLVPLAIFIAAGATSIHRSNFFMPQQLDAHGFGRAMIVAAFALFGMEASLCASGEVIRPNRAIPRALAVAVVSTTTLYVVIQVIAQGVLGSSLATSKAPLSDAMGHLHPLLRAIVLAGTAISMFGWLSSDILGSPRQLFAFARDGLFPRVLGRVDPRTGAPDVAIGCYCMLAMVLALTGTFAELLVLSALASAALYIAGCAASWVLVRRGVCRAGAPMNFRFLGSATIIGIGSMLALIFLGSRQEIIGLLILIGVSSASYLIQSRFFRAKPY